MIWIYDIETYINYFSVIFKNPKTNEFKEFLIHKDINNIDELYNFINNKNKWLIGYNSYYFDNQLLNFIYKKHSELTFLTVNEICKEIYTLAILIVKEDFREYIYNLPFNYIDLMKVGGILKSLKLVAVSIKWPKIQDLPISWESKIETEDQVRMIRDYNLNDVLISEKLYNLLLDKIRLRVDISKSYEVDVFSESDSGMANRLLEKFYSDTTGLPYRSFKNLRTERKFIKFDWVIFKDIEFKTPEFNKLLEELKGHTYYKDIPFFKKTIKFDGIEYKLGIGGIHSNDHGKIFEETTKEYIIDADINSMYPTIMINQNLAPEHLGNKFMINYRQLRDRRIKAKNEGNYSESECLKIVLNSTFGKTKNEKHWLYDPLVALRITVNGQLYILMLIEKLVLKGYKVISANTDGIVTIVPKDKEEEYFKLCEQWQEETRFSLEYSYYKKYIRRDVNNYIAIKDDNSIKLKGIFVKEISLVKGYDKPIISIALHEFFVNNIPIQQTIENHKDIYNFCIAKKIDIKFTNEFHYVEEGEFKVNILQKSVRYYISKNGGVLLKTNRENNNITNYEANKTVTIFNNFVYHKDIKDYNIDYGYYINFTQKIIDEIINPQLTLF